MLKLCWILIQYSSKSAVWDMRQQAHWFQNSMVPIVHSQSPMDIPISGVARHFGWIGDPHKMKTHVRLRVCWIHISSPSKLAYRDSLLCNLLFHKLSQTMVHFMRWTNRASGLQFAKGHVTLKALQPSASYYSILCCVWCKRLQQASFLELRVMGSPSGTPISCTTQMNGQL